MADTSTSTTTSTSAGVGTSVLPSGFIRLSRLPDALPPTPTDYVWCSQFIATDGSYHSRRMMFAQVQAAARPPCNYIAADHTALTTDAGFYLDATAAGTITLTLPPIAGVAGREIAILNVGATGVVIVQGDSPDALVGPAGLLPSLSFRPGETARLRAVVVPTPARSGWYLVGV